MDAPMTSVGRSFGGDEPHVCATNFHHHTLTALHAMAAGVQWDDTTGEPYLDLPGHAGVRITPYRDTRAEEDALVGGAGVSQLTTDQDQ